MKFSTREDYGLILAGKLAENYGNSFLSLRDIAKEEKLSFLYLEHLVSKLKNANLVKSKRGTQGGYELARNPKSIKVSEVINALEKPVKLVKCDTRKSTEATCPRVSKCVTRHLWLHLHQEIINSLDKISLAQLVKKRLHVP